MRVQACQAATREQALKPDAVLTRKPAQQQKIRVRSCFQSFAAVHELAGQSLRFS